MIPAFSARTPRERAVAVYALESLSLLVCGQPRITALACLLGLNGEQTHWQNLAMQVAITGERAPLSICPYPFEFEESVDWNGTQLTFRPIRPEDETLHAGLFSAQTPEDLYLRFFSMQRAPDHARLARLVRIDYAREMAIVACSGEPGSQTVHGVSRAVAGPGNRSAEFAVAIRSDEKGHHLGRMLMDRIIAYSRRHGTRLLEGIVLKENRRMLALALDCGFERYPNEDPTVWSVRLELQAGEGA
jgi:acetyltransferase